jgi:hypothetical protein
VKTGKKQKYMWNNMIDEDKKQVFRNVSSKKQKLQIVNSKRSSKNMKKRKKRKSRVNISMRRRLQL